MPTYEYGCKNCDHLWEEDQSIKSNPTTECPICKKNTAKRLISKSNFTLHGGGWANEGYSNK